MSVITGIRVPSVSLYRQSHVELLDFQVKVAPGSTRELNFTADNFGGKDFTSTAVVLSAVFL